MKKPCIQIKLKHLVNAKVYVSAILEEVKEHLYQKIEKLIAYDKKFNFCDLPNEDIAIYKKDKHAFDHDPNKKDYIEITIRTMIILEDVKKLRGIIEPFQSVFLSLEENKELDFLAGKIMTLKSVKSINNNISKYNELMEKTVEVDKKIVLTAMNYSRIDIIREKVFSI